MTTTLSPKLLEWLARNKFHGLSDEVLRNSLKDKGLTDEEAGGALAHLYADPIFKAAQPYAGRLRRRHAMMEIKRFHNTFLPKQPLAVYDTLDNHTFLQAHYYANRPALMRRQIDHWQILKNWTPQWFLDHYGDHQVIAQLYREQDSRYHLNTEDHFYQLYMSDFVNKVLAQPMSNDSYLVLNLKDLFEQGLNFYTYLEPLPGILDMDHPEDINFWFGPGGTVTRLHHDVMNYLLVQIYGKKRVWLVAPEQAHLVYDHGSIYGDVDAESPDLERHPLFQRAEVLTVDLEPGQALFIPVGWWHQVRSLSISISLNFGNFVVSNKYHW